MAESPFKQTIDHAVMEWMLQRLSRKMPGLPLPTLDDIMKGTEMLETNMDKWEAQAITKGVLLGKREGKREGEALALQRLLTKRFGVLPVDIAQMVAAAGTEQIEAWLDRVQHRRFGRNLPAAG